MARIKVLDKFVAERIAAGEVVERPASVVKELAENSLDAAATDIVVEVAGAGLELIRVSDDGTGIDPADLPLAVQRFATSKIASAEDLLTVRSYGFRGEALPSIAAVARVEIVSAVARATEGRRLTVEGGEVIAEEPVGAPAGTTVTVRHLFYNTPARRRFLKSPTREFALIVDVLNRFGLAHPDVSFRLIHEGTEVLRFPPARNGDRIAAVIGDDAFVRMLTMQLGSGDFGVRGWLGKPELGRSTRRQQYVFVNRRPVHSRVLSSAVEQAYRQLLPVGRYPVFVLFIDLPPRRVDVNIHPRKLEVRFDDEHQIFGVVSRAVRAALREAQLLRTVEAHPVPVGGTPGILDLTPAGAMAVEAPGVEVTPGGRLPAMRLLGQLHRTYLLAQSDEGLVVIDQHAAHERVLYERLLQRRAGGTAPNHAVRGIANGQVLVTPVPVSLSLDAARALEAHQPLFAVLGFELEPFGDRTVLMRAVPQIAVGKSPDQLLRDLLAELMESERATAAQTLLERLAISTACHTAIRAGDVLAPDQMGSLLRDLGQTEDPFTCFHGRPTLVTIPLSNVEKWFLRR